MYAGKSAWARAPDRGTGDPVAQERRSVRHQTSKEETFSPNLTSNPAIRQKVMSSGYGKAPVAKKEIQPRAISVKEEQELVGATFKPKLNVSDKGKRLRKSAPSSGYGKSIPIRKEVTDKDAPTFKPQIGHGKQSRKLLRSSGSSGYGKVAAQSPQRPQPERPTFKPDMNLSKTATRIRKKAPSKAYLQERPRTAPARTPPKPEVVMLHTLAADHSAPPEVDESLAEREASFVLDCSALATALLDPHCNCLPTPQPVVPLKSTKMIKEKAPSSGYANGGYSPTHVPVSPKDPGPANMVFTRATSYADTPELLEKPSPTHEAKKLKERIATAGYGSPSYNPPVTPTAPRTTPRLWKPAYGPALLPADALPEPAKSKLNESVPSSSYGTVSPEVVHRREKAPLEKPFKMGTKTTTLLPACMLGTEAERDRVEVREISSHAHILQGEQATLASTQTLE
eukprot:m.292659 g.292659  ORF g.292659 m.292659 type:complete len:455 (-) comp20006_c0_seq4:313-1677(-)